MFTKLVPATLPSSTFKLYIKLCQYDTDNGMYVKIMEGNKPEICIAKLDLPDFLISHPMPSTNVAASKLPFGHSLGVLP